MRTLRERFDRHIDRAGECWLWRTSRGQRPVIQAGGAGTKTMRAHVASWLLHRGEVPPGHAVIPTCGEPLCVRPEHLKLVRRGAHPKRTPERYVRRLSDPVERFWAHVTKTDGCWCWTGPTHHFGYGSFSLGRRRDGRMLAHRFSWELVNGPILDGLHVLHTCDNPPCVNPAHLFLGSDADNVADKVAKGRQPRGGRHGPSKITEVQVREIRRRWTAGGVSQRALGREYGLTHGAIGAIVSGRYWKHVT